MWRDGNIPNHHSFFLPFPSSIFFVFGIPFVGVMLVNCIGMAVKWWVGYVDMRHLLRYIHAESKDMNEESERKDPCTTILRSNKWINRRIYLDSD